MFDYLKLNKSEWKLMTEEQLDLYKKQIFDYYRSHGFPYFPTDNDFRIKEYQKFLKFNEENLIEGDLIKQMMHGLSFLWSYFPHAFNVRCNDLMSPLEAFNDDTILKSVIDKRIKYGDNMSDNGFRKTLKIHSGVQSVSNFRPTAACAIYNKYAKGKVVYDMSCGYGGRMLGAIKSGVKKYYGTEPCKPTYEALLRIYKDINNFERESLFDKNVSEIEIYNKGSEEVLLDKNSVDFCFTSPPYFNTEKYSDEETQSYKKYPKKEDWLECFLGKTIDNCNYCLKNDGILAINIANVSNYKNLENDFNELMIRKRFKPIEILKYSLSGIGGKKKYEPVFVFMKNI